MTSVRKTSVGQLAALAALGLVAGSATAANAADLGGNCCADLEERIAELEATTARKGNRKVSLTVSGWVNEGVFFWDDGTESNVYVGTNSLEQTRVKFTGEAKIDGDWAAGYKLELGISAGSSNQFDQDLSNAGAGVIVRQSNWYIKNKNYGQLTVGLQGTATYHLLDDADATVTRNFADAEAAAVAQGRFFLKSNGANVTGNLRWSDVLRGPNNGTPGQNGRRNAVRYDSPAIAGFVATASWGEDDMAGAALTYKGELGDFKILAKGGYEKSTDENTQQCHQTFDAAAAAGTTGKADCEWYGAAATIQHAPTGLYVYGGFGQENDNSRVSDTTAAQKAFVDDTDTFWFIQAGIEAKLTSLGKTTLFGEYRNDNTGSNVRGNAANPAPNQVLRTRGADIDFIAAGVVQSIDAAAMDVYLIYRHADGDVVVPNGTKTSLDDFNMVMSGVKITF